MLYQVISIYIYIVLFCFVYEAVDLALTYWMNRKQPFEHTVLSLNVVKILKDSVTPIVKMIN